MSFRSIVFFCHTKKKLDCDIFVTHTGTRGQKMDYSTFLIPVVCSLISCFAAVVSGYFSFRPASKLLENDFDELSSMVEKMAKESRKERMSRVRNIALATDNSSGSPHADSNSPSQSTGQNIGGIKAELRAKLRQQLKG